MSAPRMIDMGRERHATLDGLWCLYRKEPKGSQHGIIFALGDTREAAWANGEVVMCGKSRAELKAMGYRAKRAMVTVELV